MAPGRLLRTSFVAAVAVALFGLAWASMLASIGSGIAGAEAAAIPQASENAIRDNRAANLAFSLFCAAEVAMAALIAGLLPRRLHWLARFTGALAIGTLLVYAAGILSLSIGGAPDPIEWCYRAMDAWIRSIV